MIGDFLKAAGQLGDPRFRRVFLLSIGLTLALLAVLYAGWWRLTGGTPEPGSWTLFGWDVTWLDWLVDLLARIGGLIAVAFLMMPVASLFIGMFLEEIADAVEAKYYPERRATRKMGVGELLWDGVLFTLTLLGANFAALILYVIFLPAGPFIFLAVNGWLLGRQYYELVAARHVGFKAARIARKKAQGQVFVAGVLMAAPLSIPLVGLVIPVLGVATFTHMHHRIGLRPGA